MTSVTPYLFTCEACKNAPQKGPWTRSYRWKTQKGYDNHNCVLDEVAPIIAPQPDTGKPPCWLVGGEPLTCPLCEGVISYSGIRNPGLHFACPRCGGEVQFVPQGQPSEVKKTDRVCSICRSEMVRRKGKHGMFWGCSAYTRKNPCKGKAVMAEVVDLVRECVLAPYRGGADVLDCRDAGKMETFSRLAAKDEVRGKRWGR